MDDRQDSAAASAASAASAGPAASVTSVAVPVPGPGGGGRVRFAPRRPAGVRRWLAPWKDSRETPVLYHVVSRVVDRRKVLGRHEKEHFRRLMRAYEQFTGCRVLAYCVMGNHFHVLLEVPPRPDAGLAPESLDRNVFAHRLAGIYPAAKVAEVMKRLDVALEAVEAANGTAPVERLEALRVRATADIAGPFLDRMHDLSEFMKGLLQRFTRWFNRRHQRSGTLWEERFKSVIVEGGVASRTVAAYIDLNPVRAGLAEDPADYRWSSYGEAVGAGGATVGGLAARAGLVRALLCGNGAMADARRWKEVAGGYRGLMAHALRRKRGAAGEAAMAAGSDAAGAGAAGFDCELGMAAILARRVRYFTAGAVIGSRGFVELCFEQARWRFGARRKSGARRPRGTAAEAAGVLWSARDLRRGVDDASGK